MRSTNAEDAASKRRARVLWLTRVHWIHTYLAYVMGFKYDTFCHISDVRYTAILWVAWQVWWRNWIIINHWVQRSAIVSFANHLATITVKLKATTLNSKQQPVNLIHQVTSLQVELMLHQHSVQSLFLVYFHWLLIDSCRHQQLEALLYWLSCIPLYLSQQYSIILYIL